MVARAQSLVVLSLLLHLAPSSGQTISDSVCTDNGAGLNSIITSICALTPSCEGDCQTVFDSLGGKASCSYATPEVTFLLTTVVPPITFALDVIVNPCSSPAQISFTGSITLPTWSSAVEALVGPLLGAARERCEASNTSFRVPHSTREHGTSAPRKKCLLLPQ